MRVLVDTNVLLRALDSAHPHSASCAAAMSRILARGDELVGCLQVMAEFWVVATRPKQSNGLGLSPTSTEKALKDASAAIIFLDDPPGIAAKWLSLVVSHGVQGKQAHDAKLVAWMQAYGVTHLLTLNLPDFDRYKGITCISPLDQTFAQG